MHATTKGNNVCEATPSQGGDWIIWNSKDYTRKKNTSFSSHTPSIVHSDNLKVRPTRSMLCKQRMAEICTTVYCVGLFKSITLHFFLNPASDICHPFFFPKGDFSLPRPGRWCLQSCVQLFIYFLVPGIMQRSSRGVSVNQGDRILEWVTEKPIFLLDPGSSTSRNSELLFLPAFLSRFPVSTVLLDWFTGNSSLLFLSEVDFQYIYKFRISHDLFTFLRFSKHNFQNRAQDFEIRNTISTTHTFKKQSISDPVQNEILLSKLCTNLHKPHHVTIWNIHISRGLTLFEPVKLYLTVLNLKHF